ncbi:TetR/AcrR family transcriptional regulator [Acidaminobacter sp. JC074]|uniref:TetR/AcrR family transcriptional regulator n=1 Tax=Acidaminobacter sp. JC074 TaxID=2530199 RepID=UPI001F0E388B|nr:TetR/AcrR family transcriptional regulator [Acidaminobacter sp. JC074]
MKQKKSEITREKIFQASIKMFREKGYLATRTIDITNEIGISHASFFTYFKTKENIIIELFYRSDLMYKDFFEKSQSPDAITHLLNFIKMQFEFFEDNFNYEIASIMYSTETSLNNKTDYLISKERNTYKFLKEIVNEGIKNEQFIEMDLDKLTDIIHRTQRGIVFDWILHKGDYSLVDVGEDTFKNLLDGIKR